MLDRFALLRRAAVHAALGEPVRLAIVDDLALSDRSPTELCERHGLATNLLAHHLDVLESAGVVVRFTSAGDRRRKYVRLGQTVTTAVPPAGPVRRGGHTLFVCTHNSARSQLAAALWTARTGEPASSAGTEPAPRVHRGAVAAARRAGLDLRGAMPAMVDEAMVDDPDTQVITVCDRAHEELDVRPSWWHWSIPDPVPQPTPAAFDSVVTDLEGRISVFARPTPTRPTPTRPTPTRPTSLQER